MRALSLHKKLTTGQTSTSATLLGYTGPTPDQEKRRKKICHDVDEEGLLAEAGPIAVVLVGPERWMLDRF